MLDFMVIGLPRSGTTWAANLLTTDKTICLHDPMYQYHYEDLDSIEKGGKRVGVSCTGLYRFGKWVNQHPARKVVLHRPLHEVNKSLVEIGLNPLEESEVDALYGILGCHFNFSDLFSVKGAAAICDRLGVPFDADRHAELVQIEMQPKFSGLKVGAEVTRRLVEEMQRAIS